MSQKIHIQATVNVPTAKAWTLWTEPDHITNWNFASDDWRCPRAENDLRAGGRLLYRMEAVDGSFGFDFDAIYDEVVHEARVAYTMSDGRQVETTFEGLGDSTRVSTTFDAEQENPAEMQRTGWQAILENFKSYAESL
ncbi:MAG: SRPBCC family protein [Anaerolineae bacterium]|nr:SRPBCC family protein [Anaerolineae bacterium]